MAIEIVCPGCAAKYRVADASAGKRVKCKKCSSGITVPGVDEEPTLRLRPEEDAAADRLPTLVKAVQPPVLRPVSGPPPLPAVFAAETVFTPALVSRRQAFGSGHTNTVSGRKIRPTSAAPEGFSPLLLMVYFGLSIGIAVYLNATSKVMPTKDIWTETITSLLCLFTVIGPLTLLGVWGASKAMAFELASRAYLKAAAIAATPHFLVLLVPTLPDIPVLKLVVLLAVVPVSFYLVLQLFSLTLVEALVAWLLGMVGWGLGLFLTVVVMVGALVGSKYGATHGGGGTDVLGQSVVAQGDLGDAPPQPGPAQTLRYTRPAPVDGVESQLQQVRDRANAMAGDNWLADSSREQMGDRLNELATELAALTPMANTDDRRAREAEAEAAVATLRDKVAALPSEKIDDSIFKPVTDAHTWHAEPLVSDPASYHGYWIAVPRDAKIDLGSSETDPVGLSWEFAPRGRINLTSVPRTEPRQMRPFVKTRSFMRPGPDLLVVDVTNVPVEVKFGMLNGMPTTRIATRPEAGTGNRSFGERWVKYVVARGADFLVVTVTTPVEDARTFELLDATAQSVRPLRGDEQTIDPFRPESVVARLGDHRAAAIVRRMGAAAEPALLAALPRADLFLKPKIVALLGDVGTKAAVPALMTVARGRDRELAAAARAAVRKIAPEQMDETAEALLELDEDRFDRHEPLEILAAMRPRPDDPRRPKVSGALLRLVQGDGFMTDADAALLGDALQAWQTPTVVPQLLPLLAEHASYNNRRTAMTVLAHIKDKRGVFPICQWLLKDTEHAVEALTEMGPVAEDDLDKLLANRDPTIRTSVCNVLAVIGTQKSLKALKSFVYDRKSPTDAIDGAAAIDQINGRIANPAAVAPPPTTPAVIPPTVHPRRGFGVR